MYEHNMVVKFNTGEGTYEGFSGSGFTIAAAVKDALKNVQIKVNLLNGYYNTKCCYNILSKQQYDNLPKDVKTVIQKDWEVDSIV